MRLGYGLKFERGRLTGLIAVVMCLSAGWSYSQEKGRKAALDDGGILPEILEITPSDVFVEVFVLRKELELLRVEMGRPRSDQVEIEVTNAAPREVHFQARTLFDKSNRIAYEFLGEYSKPPNYPISKIYPYHVFVTVKAALRQILRVKAHLGVLEQVEIPLPDPTKRPTEVYRAIVQANRQLNLMLEQEYRPADVFQQVSLAIVYAGRLLKDFPGAETSPPPPPFERGRFPPDVYRRLVRCFEHIRSLAEISDLSMLHLDIDSSNPDRLSEVTPSDVYDVATLVVSELAFLHSQQRRSEPVVEEFVSFSERIFPSHVYQRVGILEEQLRDLLERVKEVPNWLRPG